MAAPRATSERSRKPRPQAPADDRRTAVSAGASVFPGPALLIDPRGPFLIPLVLLLVSRMVMLFMIPTAAEDAFITFRYARNLASGNGLVYNPGEHVMGFTSPLWTVWSAVGILLFKNPVPWTIGWSLVADLVTLTAGGMMILSTAGVAAAWAFTFFFAVWPFFPALTISSMEMSLCVALFVLAAAVVHSRSRFAGPVLAALALTRPEGMIGAVVLALAATWRARLIALGLVGVALVALTVQFGSPIPNSLLTKASVYGTPGPWAGRHWWEWISPIVLGRWATVTDGLLMMFLAVLTAPAAAAGAATLWTLRSSGLARLAAAFTLIWLGYAIVGAAYFWWYFVFPLMAIALLASVGLPRITRGPWIPVALVLFCLSVWSLAISLYGGRSGNEAQTFGTMAAELSQRARPGDTVMLEPIGMIGYMSPVRVIDETGLVSPEVAKRRLRGAGWYTDIVAEHQPRWLIVRPGVLGGQEAFAGAGRPFRSKAERDTMLARYRSVVTTGDASSPNSLILLERTP